MHERAAAYALLRSSSSQPAPHPFSLSSLHILSSHLRFPYLSSLVSLLHLLFLVFSFSSSI